MPSAEAIISTPSTSSEQPEEQSLLWYVKWEYVEGGMVDTMESPCGFEKMEEVVVIFYGLIGLCWNSLSLSGVLLFLREIVNVDFG
jgi:hypothetical protein